MIDRIDGHLVASYPVAKIEAMVHDVHYELPHRGLG
jgi:hypothetical protein